MIKLEIIALSEKFKNHEIGMLGSEVRDVERNLTKAVYVFIYKVDISCRILIIILNPIRV